jgi:hypothetical protein
MINLTRLERDPLDGFLGLPTPGPLVITLLGDGAIVSDQRGLRLAKCTAIPRHGDNDGIGSREATANAKRFARVGDLETALMACRAYLRGDIGDRRGILSMIDAALESRPMVL